jgi:hypothetical protein
MATKKKNVETLQIAIADDIKPTLGARVLRASPEQLSLVEQVQSHVLLKKLEAAIGGRIKVLRDALMTVGEAKGSREEGSTTDKLVVDGSTIAVEHRKSKTPNEEQLKTLLAAREIDIMTVFDEVKTIQFNPSKLDYLISIGKIKAEEIDAMCNVTPALRVYAAKPLKEAVEPLFAGLPLKEEK